MNTPKSLQLQSYTTILKKQQILPFQKLKSANATFDK